MSEQVATDYQYETPEELLLAITDLFGSKSPNQKNVSEIGQWLLTPDLLTAVLPDFPEELAYDIVEDANYTPETGAALLICRGVARTLGMTSGDRFSDHARHTIVHPFMYASSERSGYLPAEKAWSSVTLEQLEGRIVDRQGTSYSFSPERKLLTVSSFRLDENGRSTRDGITFTMVLGSPQEPTFQKAGDPEAVLPLIDPEQSSIDNVLAIVRAAKNLAA